MKLTQRFLPVALASLMAACATTTPPLPKPTTPVITPSFPALPTSVAATVTPPMVVETSDVWGKLRDSFAMPDCDADPQILTWAHRYTQNPQRFEAQMKNALSQLVYVQQIANKYNVAGEFVLLPWVESQYQSVPGHRNLPAGMWQIVPSTAHAMGLHVNQGYDGRLDTSAATESVMRLLHNYYNELHDWRLVDYAFNRGEYAVQRMVQQHGVPPQEPAIPKWPVPRVTKEHLTKLLALACVVREPSRFNVELPVLSADDHLEAIDISPGMTLSGMANQAGMGMDDLKRLNPALRNDALDSNNSSHVLMPHHNAQQLRGAAQSANAQDMTASTTAPADAPSSKDAAAAQDAAPTVAETHHAARTHKVKPGESLWQIAHDYSISVSTLQRLNHLRGNAIKPGQVLKLDSP